MAERTGHPSPPDAMFTLYKAAYHLKDKTPRSLLELKAEMLAAADKEPAVQDKAVKAYDGRIAAVVRDVQKCGADPHAKSVALAALAGVTVEFGVRNGEQRDQVVMEAKVRGLFKGDVTCTVSFAAPGAARPPASKPIKVMPYRTQAVTRSCRVADLSRPKTLRATAKLVWLGKSITIPLSQTIANTAISHWWIIGPFNNPGGHAADVKHPVETEAIGLKKKYRGQGGAEIAWRKAERSPQAHVIAEHIVNFIGLYGQKNNVAAYALTWIDSDKAQDAVLAAGSDDGVIVWLNGKQVHKKLVGRGYSSKADRVPIHLKKGRNKLLLKITQGGGGWAFAAHILDKDGDPIEGLRYTVNPDD